MTDKQILQEALVFIRKGWKPGHAGQTMFGRPINPTSDDAVAWNIFGAIDRAIVPISWPGRMDRWESTISSIAAAVPVPGRKKVRYMTPDEEDDVFGETDQLELKLWEIDKGRTKEQIVAAFERAIKNAR